PPAQHPVRHLRRRRRRRLPRLDPRPTMADRGLRPARLTGSYAYSVARPAEYAYESLPVVRRLPRRLRPLELPSLADKHHEHHHQDAGGNGRRRMRPILGGERADHRTSRESADDSAEPTRLWPGGTITVEKASIQGDDHA